MKEGIGVLLLFFNKVDTTGLVLERILEAKPSVLLLTELEKEMLMMRRQFRNAGKE